MEVNKDIEGKISKFFQGIAVINYLICKKTTSKIFITITIGTREELEKFARNFEGQLKQKESELTNVMYFYSLGH